MPDLLIVYFTLMGFWQSVQIAEHKVALALDAQQPHPLAALEAPGPVFLFHSLRLFLLLLDFRVSDFLRNRGSGL